ncbi:U-box domain [Dillenia turbinata]|uniref:U-box domain-containing protein n=1 Tax=Dillenia turbinata TaxID=194707 RepID=A0AAN8ZGC8_9MAGN
MVREDLFITIPSFFKCPISLEVMKSPVSLCTGVTYDRSSIQAWLDNGNNTCPATMQVLQSKDFVPNLTLHRLIRSWSDSVPPLTPSNGSSSLSRDQVRSLIRDIPTSGDGRFDSLSKILDFAKSSDENRKFLANINDFVSVIVGILCNGDLSAKIRELEQIVIILDLILMEKNDLKQQIWQLISNRIHSCLPSISLILRKGSTESKIASARFLEAISFDSEAKRAIIEKQRLFEELVALISSEAEETAIEAALTSIISLTNSRLVKTKVIKLGTVKTLTKLLTNSALRVSAVEKALKLLEILSTCTEGRTAITEDLNCVASIVQRLMKVSSSATESAVVVLWSVCYLIRDERAQETVTKNNGLAKVLLLLQTNCSPIVRQLCGDLMKVFRVNSKSCLSSYETKTTHIMPY